MAQTLKKQTKNFIKKEFPEVENSHNWKEFLNTPLRGLWVVAIVIILFVINQFVSPHCLHFFKYENEDAAKILDQRISNLATLFSITLVVIGWLITNLSSKEFITYQLLFRRIYLYPIFYFVVSLIGCLIVISILRGVESMNIGDALVLATTLMILALVAIVTCFTQLIRVVDTQFFYQELGKEVMKVVNDKAIRIIQRSISEDLYVKFCKNENLIEFDSWYSDISNCKPLKILPSREKMQQPTDDIPNDLIFSKATHMIKDIDFDKLAVCFKKLSFHDKDYYVRLHLGMGINSDDYYFYSSSPAVGKDNAAKIIKNAFDFESFVEPKMFEDNPIKYLRERLKKDTKEGKYGEMKSSLEILGKIADLDNKIKQKC